MTTSLISGGILRLVKHDSWRGWQTLKLPYQEGVQFNTDLNSLPQVLSWFKQFNQPPIPYSVWLEYQIALAEGFTNAVRHAHASKTPETPIALEITIDHEAIELKIWDCGSGFNLDPSLTNPQIMEQTAERGRGLKIIRKIADTVSYTRMGQRNCLSIVKYYANS